MKNQPSSNRRKLPAGTGSWSSDPTSVRYWQQRLLRRRYTEPARPRSAQEYFARIEHDGHWAYFPLEIDKPKAAAMKAREIHLEAVQAGWTFVCRKYAREFTLAIFWLPNPLLSTYTTLFTRPQDSPLNQVTAEGKPPGGVSIALFEPEDEVRRSVMHWLNRIPGCNCISASGQIADFLDRRNGRSPDVMFFNQYLPDLSGNELAVRLREALPGASFFSYGIYKNSDELFVTITGVDGGYFLQRREPMDLLNPIGIFPDARQPPAGAMAARVLHYFGTLIAPTAKPADARLVTTLNLVTTFTEREYEILTCMTNGITANKAIAEALKISAWTVGTHLKNIFEKLGAHSRTEAVMKFLQR